VVVAAKAYRVEMRSDHLAVKRLHARGGWQTIPLGRIVEQVAAGQKMLPL
jgi:hypothetical protein